MKNNIFGYHLQDSRNVKDTIKDKNVDVIITSPPYWNLKDYGINNQIGFGQNYETYLTELIEILNNCKNVLKDKGSMWIVVDSFKQGGNIRMLPFEIADRLQKRGWHLQDIIIWQKDKTLPWSSKGKLRIIFEYVLFFTKSNEFNFYVDELRETELKKWWPKYPERYNPKGKVPSRVWYLPIPVQGWGNSWVKHFCPFPPKLIENILLLTTKKESVVLDPFAGSGSVLAQSNVMGRKSIGFDLNQDYKKMYYENVLPFFDTMWKERSKELEKKSENRKYLEKTIISLRKIKYPITLCKELIKKNNEFRNNIKSVIAYEKGNLGYYFVLENNDELIKEQILILTKEKKMKKFGLETQINFLISKKIDLNKFPKNMYLYKNGVHNVLDSEINLSEINMDKLKENDKLVPVISNIKVNQKNHLI